MFKRLLNPSLFAIAIIASAPAHAQAVRGTVVSVADGQTLTVLANGRHTPVVLAHIQAPQRCDLHADEAQQSLAALALGKDVVVDIAAGSGKGRRTLAVVRLQDGTNLNVEQVARGMARAQDRRNSELAAAEANARIARAGVWNTAGTPMPTHAARCANSPHPVAHGGIPVAAGNDGTVPKATTDRVLGNIRDFAGGQPSPNIVYSTRAVGEAANAPGRGDSRSGPAVSMIDPPPPHKPLAPSKLITNTIDKQPMQSTWGSSR